MQKRLPLISKIKIRNFKRNIKTQEQKEMVLDEIEKERKRRIDYFNKNSNNIRILYNATRDNYSLEIYDKYNRTISEIVLSQEKDDVWVAKLLSTGNFKNKNDLYRDLGFAKKLILEAIKFVKDNDGKSIIFFTKPRLINFYENFGAKRLLISFKNLRHFIFGYVPMRLDIKN